MSSSSKVHDLHDTSCFTLYFCMFLLLLLKGKLAFKKFHVCTLIHSEHFYPPSASLQSLSHSFLPIHFLLMVTIHDYFFCFMIDWFESGLCVLTRVLEPSVESWMSQQYVHTWKQQFPIKNKWENHVSPPFIWLSASNHRDCEQEGAMDY